MSLRAGSIEAGGTARRQFQIIESRGPRARSAWGGLNPYPSATNKWLAYGHFYDSKLVNNPTSERRLQRFCKRDANQIRLNAESSKVEGLFSRGVVWVRVSLLGSFPVLSSFAHRWARSLELMTITSVFRYDKRVTREVSGCSNRLKVNGRGRSTRLLPGR